MVTKTKEKKQRKQFKISVVEEKYFPFLRSDQIAEAEYMENTKFHFFDLNGTSDDPEIQRFDDIVSSMGVPPESGGLVVTRVREKYYLERYPNISGSFIATVLSASKKM